MNTDMSNKLIDIDDELNRALDELIDAEEEWAWGKPGFRNAVRVRMARKRVTQATDRALAASIHPTTGGK